MAPYQGKAEEKDLINMLSSLINNHALGFIHVLTSLCMTIKSVWYHRNVCFLQEARYKYKIEEVLSIWLWQLYHIITTSGNVALKQRQHTIQGHLLS